MWRYGVRITSPDGFLGRAEELRILRTVIANARNRLGGAIHVHGDPGVGKTALIEAALRDVVNARVIRVSGYEVEAALAYGAMQRIGRPLGEYVGDIAPAQGEALRVAAGLSDGTPPQRALVGLGVLSVLAAAGDEALTICVIDDAHHLDPESLEVFGLVARRLSAESVALLFASRDDDAVHRALAGIPDLALNGLDPASAAEVLRASVSGELDPAVVVDVVSFVGGNPLALRDLGSELSVPAITAAAIGRSPLPLGRRLEDHYLARAGSLSPPARRWLVVAAAESTGDASVVRAAARGIGLADDVADEAEQLGLVDLRYGLQFRHPLVRSAIYNSATEADRRTIHARLSQVLADRDLRELAAWHAAAACVDTDPDVAARLVDVAHRAASRGGLRSQALLLARAAELTPDAGDREELLITAAESSIASGAAVLARQLLGPVDKRSVSAERLGRILLVEGLCTLYIGGVGMRDLLAVMVAGADALTDSPRLHQAALVHAVNAALILESQSDAVDIGGLAQRIRAHSGAGERAYALVLRAVASFALDPYDCALPRLREAAEAIERMPDGFAVDFSIVTLGVCLGMWDCDAAARILNRVVLDCRERGAVREAYSALWALSTVELSRMNPRRAGEYLAQAHELRHALGYIEETANPAYLVWQGAPAADIERLVEFMEGAGYGGITRMARGARGIDDLARGDYTSAFARLSDAMQQPFLHSSFHLYAEYIEAAARSGHGAEAQKTHRTLDEHAAAAGTSWVRGLAARSSALLSEGAVAESHFRRSIELLDGPGHRGDRARSELLFGEWLRRMRRRTAARQHLRAALEGFADVGATAFEQRARRELRATGEPAETSGARHGELTPQELEVARLAAGGATNADIGTALIISPNTVDYHLRKVFRKLGVSSRRQLRDAFR